MPKMSILGYELSVQKKQGSTTNEQLEKLKKAIETLKKYKAGKEFLENEIIENERWWKMHHWEIIRQRSKKSNEPEPVSAYLFSTIANKHADAMDNYPEPNMLPREESDEEEAQRLSDIVPVVLERNDYKTVYDDVWWYKLKNGTAVKGIFWNETLDNGLGDIDIQKLDLLNVFWEPGITNIQKSSNLFIATLVESELLKQLYPDIIPDDYSGCKTIDIKQYIYDDNVDNTSKSIVIDWYYKKVVDGKMVLHLTKFVDEYWIGSTEDSPEEYPNGLYEHGRYPIEFDVLFPEEGTPVGFGYVNVVRNPQMYIDKLDQIITKNALISGKQRYLVSENADVNEDELLDLGVDIIHASNVTEEKIRILQGNPLPAFIVNHREMKIQELKETSGSNDFSRGGTGGGVTAASAIMALQEAGNKLSRDMIQRSYNSFRKECQMVIELIGQYYTEDRKFRIDGKDGSANYISYNNSGLKEQQLDPMYDGEEEKYRKPIFDIKVRPEKQSPFSRMAHNELAKELFGAGMFNPQMADQSLIALEMMSFEGKEKIIKEIKKNSQLMQQLEQSQMQSQQMQQQMMQMSALIQKLTGQDMGATDYLLQEKSDGERLAKSVGQV